MTSYPPRFLQPGGPFTGYASSSTISGGRFVKQTGDLSSYGDYPIAHCGAGEACLGVAVADAIHTHGAREQSRRTAVYNLGVMRVETGGAITAGDEVQSDAAGKAVTKTTGVALGRAMHTEGNNGVVSVLMYGGIPVPGAAGSGNFYAQGTPQSAIADSAVTATNPTAIDAAAGEATAAALDDTQALETQVSALVVDVTALSTKLNSALAALRKYGVIAP